MPPVSFPSFQKQAVFCYSKAYLFYFMICLWTFGKECGIVGLRRKAAKNGDCQERGHE
jgi:glutathionylspermidine synthase